MTKGIPQIIQNQIDRETFYREPERAWKVQSDTASGLREGDTVYPFTGYDYGLARDDDMAFPRLSPHVKVQLPATVRTAESSLMYTCPLSLLKPAITLGVL